MVSMHWKSLHASEKKVDDDEKAQLISWRPVDMMIYCNYLRTQNLGIDRCQFASHFCHMVSIRSTHDPTLLFFFLFFFRLLVLFLYLAYVKCTW